VIRLFVFDLDGTLVDSLRDLADSANELLVSYGTAPLETATIGGMVGDGAARLVARACAAVGIAPRDALARFLEIYDARLLTHTRPYEGMPDVLATLGRGASLAVLTNKPLGATRRILAGLDLAKFFDEDAVIGGDGPWPRKPDTAGLLHLCERAAVTPAAAVLVGDSHVDWRTARDAGTAICLARYGFGFLGFPSGALDGREQFIDTPAELLRLRSPDDRPI
jgi:phosphoglycolate phosphatase